MRLAKRLQIEEKTCRVEVAENILENIKFCPASYCDEKYDCDTSGMGWSECQEHILYNDEGMPVFEIPEIPDAKESYEYYKAIRGMYSLEANKVVYEALMAWIDGNTHR